MAPQAMRSFQLTGFGQPLARSDRPLPQPTGSEVLIRVRGAGVCHSDVHLAEGHYDLGAGRKLSFEGRIMFPRTLGHESAGEVAALGPDAAGPAVGDRVLVCSWIGCGECPACAVGDEHLCIRPRFLGVNLDGGYSDHILVPHPRYLIDLGQLDPVAAAPLVCSGLTTYSALKKFGPAITEAPIVIVGAGGLGLMALGMLKLLGGKGAVVLEIDAAKRAAALQAGALAAVDGRAPDAAEQVRAALGRAPSCMLDLVGSGETLGAAIPLLDKGGKVVVVGLIGGDAQISVPMLPMKSLTIQGSYIGSPAQLRELVELVKARGMPDLPIDRRPLEGAQAALDDLARGRVVGRVVLTP